MFRRLLLIIAFIGVSSIPTSIYGATVVIDNYLYTSTAAPIPITVPNLYTWFDAADISTLTVSSNMVSQWADKSGNNRNATQGTGANQPLSNTATINGLNVLRYDGSDFLGIPSLTTNATVFAVTKLVTPVSPSIGHTLLGGSSLGHLPVAQAGNSNTAIYLNCGTPSMYINGNLRTPTIRSQMYTDLVNGNNNTIVVFTNVTGNTLNQIAKGPSNFQLTGDIGEIIIYSRYLTTEEINIIGSYLAIKWNIAWINIAQNRLNNLFANDNHKESCNVQSF